MPNPMLNAALYYASRGWQVFRCLPGDKLPMGKWKDEATSDGDVVRRWWSSEPNANIGIACGRRSGIVVLDIDSDKGGDESLLTLVAEHGKLPHSSESLTGGGGRHILFTHPGITIPNSASKLGMGLDIRGDGGYIVAPPSLHPSGKRYEWEVSSKPSKTQLADMPRWMIDLLVHEEPGGNGHKPSVEIPDHIREGARNQTLASLAGSMRRRGMGETAIFAALAEENQERCDPPLDEEDVWKIAQSIKRYIPSAPPVFRDAPKIESRDPLNAYDSGLVFIELLNNLEGRNIKTYIPALDRSIGGLERQTLTVLAARPSMGKSTIAWQIIRNCVVNKYKGIFFSLEMSTASLWAKAACGATGIRWRDIRAGDAIESDIDKVVAKAVELMELYGERLLIDDGMNTSETIWNTVEKYHPDVVVVDHLRLVADRGDNEIQRLGNVTQRLKDMAKAFNCVVICLAQLNRGVEGRDNKRPQLSDLRDSGQIEENGDLIMMLYREDYYDPPKGRMPLSTTELLVRKFRDDIANQQILLSFDTRHQWFNDAHELKV